MNWLFVYLFFVAMGCVTDFFRLLLAYILGFEVMQFSFFSGPKLFEFNLFGTSFAFRAIPLGASVQFKESFHDQGRFSRLAIIYLPALLSFSALLIGMNFLPFSELIAAGIVFMFVNGIIVFFSMILDHHKLLYKYIRNESK